MHFVGTAMHSINTLSDEASHRTYKQGDKQEADPPGTKGENTISVYGPDNYIYQLTPGAATVADLMAMINRYTRGFAFSIPEDGFEIERSELFGPVTMDEENRFATVLHTGDRVVFDRDPEFTNSPEVCWRKIIMACRDKEFRQALVDELQMDPTFAAPAPIPPAPPATPKAGPDVPKPSR